MRFAAVVLMLPFLAAASPAGAHSWYPAVCCNGSDMGGDCHPVPCDSITETPAGYDWTRFHFKPEQAHPSLDRDCHVCVGHYESPTGTRDVPHCVFIQQNT